MRSGIRLVNLIIISSLLSGCETAADAFLCGRPIISTGGVISCVNANLVRR